MMRLVTVAVFLIVSWSSAASHAAALYLNGNGEILVRQDVIDPGLARQHGWSLVESGEAFTLQLAALVKKSESIPARKTMALFASGLSFSVRTDDPDFDRSDRPRQITLHVVLDNRKGKEEVQIGRADLLLVDESGEEHETVKCDERRNGVVSGPEFGNPTVRAGEALAGRLCVDVPGRMELCRLSVRVDNGTGEVRWLRLIP